MVISGRLCRESSAPFPLRLFGLHVFLLFACSCHSALRLRNHEWGLHQTLLNFGHAKKLQG
jgi:hypothetical protein